MGVGFLRGLYRQAILAQREFDGQTRAGWEPCRGPTAGSLLASRRTSHPRSGLIIVPAQLLVLGYLDREGLARPRLLIGIREERGERPPLGRRVADAVDGDGIPDEPTQARRAVRPRESPVIEMVVPIDSPDCKVLNLIEGSRPSMRLRTGDHVGRWFITRSRMPGIPQPAQSRLRSGPSAGQVARRPRPPGDDAAGDRPLRSGGGWRQSSSGFAGHPPGRLPAPTSSCSRPEEGGAELRGRRRHQRSRRDDPPARPPSRSTDPQSRVTGFSSSPTWGPRRRRRRAPAVRRAGLPGLPRGCARSAEHRPPRPGATAARPPSVWPPNSRWARIGTHWNALDRAQSASRDGKYSPGKPMSVIAKAIADRQSEIDRLQAEIPR